jgi:hypothetical protein
MFSTRLDQLDFGSVSLLAASGGRDGPEGFLADCRDSVFFQDIVDGRLGYLPRIEDLDSNEFSIRVEVENHLRLDNLILGGLFACRGKER